MRQQQGQLVQKVDGLDQKVEGVKQNVKELTGRVRCMDWQRLRWRRVEWERIPPDMRVMVIPFLGVQDIMSLNSAISGKRLRKQLKKSYRGAVIPAFDQHRFTEKGGFKGLRWVMKAEVCLQRCEMVVHVEEWGVIEGAGKVLRWLVDNEHGEVAAVHAMKSDAEDVCQKRDECEGEVSTLWMAAQRGYVDVVRALVGRGADINKADNDGWTPLYIASHDGHVDVVRALMEGGADIDKANNDGCTPLYIASGEGHVDVVRALVEGGADIDKADKHGWTPLYTASWEGHVDVARALVEGGADITKATNAGSTPLQVATEKKHTEIIHLLELAAQV